MHKSNLPISQYHMSIKNDIQDSSSVDDIGVIYGIWHEGRE